MQANFNQREKMNPNILSKSEFCLTIDHTLLKPDADRRQIDLLCREALEHRFAAVCVNPYWVEHCAGILTDSGIKVCTVVGFPLGASTLSVKELETRDALSHGAGEIDMVINVGLVKSHEFELVRDDIRGVVIASEGVTVKVILETCWLSEEEKAHCCRMALEAGAQFVKTSTGFGKGGATVADVRLMQQIVGGRMGIKASGGVRDLATAFAMLEAGATRLGTSSGVALASEFDTKEKKT
jgi:deoxyribose-phosphate aldolase